LVKLGEKESERESDEEEYYQYCVRIFYINFYVKAHNKSAFDFGRLTYQPIKCKSFSGVIN